MLLCFCQTETYTVHTSIYMSERDVYRSFHGALLPTDLRSRIELARELARSVESDASVLGVVARVRSTAGMEGVWKQRLCRMARLEVRNLEGHGTREGARREGALA